MTRQIGIDHKVNTVYNQVISTKESAMFMQILGRVMYFVLGAVTMFTAMVLGVI